MLQRIGTTLLLVTLVLCVAAGGIGLHPGSARAHHTYHTRLLDSTAYSLHRRGVRLGMFKLSYGIIDRLQVSTYTMPWILGAIFQDAAPNVEFKSTFLDRKRLALSASFGFLQGRILQANNTKINYFLFPVSATASVRINSRVSTHFGGMFTGISGGADSQPGGNEVEGAAVVDLLQFWGMVEWRLSRVAAFTFTVRWVPYVSDTVVKGTLVVDEGNPTLGVGLEVEFIDLNNAFALIPGFVFSWDRANIRLGVGYGDFFVEGFALVVPGDALSHVSPEFDIFVRF